MKKFLVPIFCVALIFAFTSCEGNDGIVISNNTTIEHQVIIDNGWCEYCQRGDHKHCKKGKCKHKNHKANKCNGFCLPDSL